MATYEGKWRCVRCSTINVGRDINCRSCGVKRGEDVEFFLEDDAPQVTDAERLREADAGADWICQFCGGGNRALDARCTSCGNTRTNSDKQLAEETRGVNDWSEAAQKAARESAANSLTNQPTAPAPKSIFGSRGFKFGLIGCGFLVPFLVVVIGVFAYISTLNYPVEIEVTGLEWQRSIALEEYRTVTETAWEGEMPTAARIQSSQRAIHHTDQIPTGTRSIPESYTERVSDGTERYVCGKINKKNGYFEDKYCTRTKYKSVTKTRTRSETVYASVPVYRIRHTYQVDKWAAAGDKTTSGNNFNPTWAQITVDNTRTRETGRTENYALLCREMSGNNKPLKLKLAPNDWNKYQNGMRLHGKLDFYGDLISIDEIPNGKW